MLFFYYYLHFMHNSLLQHPFIISFYSLFDHLELNTLYMFITFAVFMQPTCWPDNTNVICLLALFLQKKHIFIWLLVTQLTSQHICTVYKFSFTSGLTLCLGLIWILLLPLDILLSEFIVHVSPLSFLSVFCWYSFRWFCIFLYIVPLSVSIL